MSGSRGSVVERSIHIRKVEGSIPSATTVMKKLLFFIIWTLILSLGPITILKTTSVELLKNPAFAINFFQRITGLLAFSLLFLQIVIGSNMNKLIEKLGAWVFRFHIVEGIVIYLLVLSHPLLAVLFNFKILGSFDPFYVFTDFCVICKTNSELFLTFGRVSFWLLTIAVAAGLFRTEPWLRRRWKSFHKINYLVFFLIAIHSWFVGSDTQATPFIYFYYLAVPIVAILFVYKTYKKVFKNHSSK